MFTVGNISLELELEKNSTPFFVTINKLFPVAIFCPQSSKKDRKSSAMKGDKTLASAIINYRTKN